MNRIVWCNGTFDILHPGHIELFKVGKSLGDKLIVATDTDEKIRQDKGETKPVNNLCDRISQNAPRSIPRASQKQPKWSPTW